MDANDTKKIRLGICMAGAVSAGAYTAGVADYLIETLERWEQRKSEIRKKKERGEAITGDDELVPMHDVVVEVLSGASAGGMTAAVLAYSFNDGTYINRRNHRLIEGNYNLPGTDDAVSKLYNSWINMADEENISTFQKLMDPSDVLSVEHIKSILNSAPIDEIASNAVPATIDFQPPAFISKNLSVLLSVTNLEGVPVDIRFSNVDGEDPTRNVLKMHSGFLHYQFNDQNTDIDFPPEIITEKSKDHLAVAAKATGAFPFGLANRKIVVNHKHFDDFKNKLLTKYKLSVNLKLKEGANYVFNAIDGGTINNEPIGTTMRILESKRNLYHAGDDHYLILIDPFPTVTNAKKQTEYSEPGEYTLLVQLKKIISAIRNQSMFKQEDLLSGLEMEKKRFLIYPAKRKRYFLASGLIEGFAGFFKKTFRSHDYQLGRKNCQTFLRYYFGETVEDFQNATGTILSAQQIAQWHYDVNYGKKDAPSLKKIPLIPDMLILDKPYEEIDTPLYDGITTKELAKINAAIDARLEKIIGSSYAFIVIKGKTINKILGKALKWFPGFFKRKIFNFASGKIRLFLENVFYPQSIKQDTLLTRYADIIETKGNLSQKIKGVYAIIATGGEEVISITKDGIETRNTASMGDYIVTNDTSSLEKYIITRDKFNDRYVHDKDDYYVPNEQARVYALQMSVENIYKYNLGGAEKLITEPEHPIYIEAPWSESQTLRLNDYLVCPVNKNEVYRIAQLEFNETYRKIEKSNS